MLAYEKQYLPHLVNKICSKTLSLFIKRLILFEDELLVEKRVRHYDLEREAVVVLEGFVASKKAKIMIATFQKIKTYRWAVEKAISFDKKQVTRRTELESKMNTVTNRQEPKRQHNNLRYSQLQDSKTLYQSNHKFASNRNTLKHLLQKVKSVNQNKLNQSQHYKSNLVLANKFNDLAKNINTPNNKSTLSAVPYLRNSISRVQYGSHSFFQQKSQNYFRKEGKRQLILQKICNIESELQEMGGKQKSLEIVKELISIKQAVPSRYFLQRLHFD